MVLHLIVVITLTQFFCFIPVFSIPLRSGWEDTNSVEISNTFQDDSYDAPDFLFPNNQIFQQIPGIPGVPQSEVVNNFAESGNSTDNAMNNSITSSSTNMTQQEQQLQGVQGTVEENNNTSTPSDVELDDSQLLEAIFSMVDYEVDSEYVASDSRGSVHEEKHYLENGVETYYSYNTAVISTTNNNDN